MSVTSQQTERVVVDGIEWTPVSREGNTANYSLTTGGRVLIFAGDKLAFSFFNEYQPDFIFNRNELTFVTADGNIRYQADGKYNQQAFPGSFQYIQCSVYPQNMEDTVSLEASVNQESATPTLTRLETYIRIIVTSVDPSKPLEVHLGNVLLSYVYPA